MYTQIKNLHQTFDGGFFIYGSAAINLPSNQ
jgi:hypothetical protein